ncbi:sulfurtransferase complex subunit TusB [Shimwellia pseudoproteus]|uniref:sulfurtransferase complex subunit TusB n=1 Tax=Shimwellia pseudoproteus TaxID=570012 RepID=UPI0018EBA832|nr:sulfurtransferase complex subunit TusB [Shimwellia pseudoproteus]MBJ3815047.1 sulfurtransferase complex subunit TusB [Shimwellia pseudoproteus]
MLHTLSHSPGECDMTTLMAALSPGDDVLLIQNGVIAALPGPALDLLLAAPISVSVLGKDLAARGLAAQISTAVKRVSYTEFVRLAAQHRAQMAW